LGFVAVACTGRKIFPVKLEKETYMNSTISGVLVSVCGIGALITGEPGSGKSQAALDLMAAGHKLIADDVIHVVKTPEGLIGRSLEEDPRIEVRGLGVFPANQLFEDSVLECAKIDFAVRLDSYRPTRDAGRVFPQIAKMEICGASVPLVLLPLHNRADIGMEIEFLVKLFTNGKQFRDEVV
jgi:HPr kinase/phosphorylase